MSAFVKRVPKYKCSKERKRMKKRITALALAIFMVMGTVAVAAGTE